MPCFYHPDRDAVNTCSRCGQPVCSECNLVTGSHPICRNCWDNITKKGIYPSPISELKAEKRNNRGFIALGIAGCVVVICLILFFVARDTTAPITSQLPQIPPMPNEPKTTTELPQEIEPVIRDESGLNPIPYSFNQYTDKQPPAEKANGDLVHLVNNPNAKDPSFDLLKSFIRNDGTDKGEYKKGISICVDFAETLHNNAEQNGIKAAFVGIDFMSPPGHAINAFQTTDRGMVYIDCTGQKMEKEVSCEIDSIAYVEIEELYGVIGISRAESPSYDYYITYKEKWGQYWTKVWAYQRKVESFNKSVESLNTLYVSEGVTLGETLSEEEYQIYHFKRSNLLLEALRLDVLRKQMDSCFRENMEIVKTVHVFW